MHLDLLSSASSTVVGLLRANQSPSGAVYPVHRPVVESSPRTFHHFLDQPMNQPQSRWMFPTTNTVGRRPWAVYNTRYLFGNSVERRRAEGTSSGTNGMEARRGEASRMGTDQSWPGRTVERKRTTIRTPARENVNCDSGHRDTTSGSD